MKTLLVSSLFLPLLSLALAAAPDETLPLSNAVPAGAFAYTETDGFAELIKAARNSELYRTIAASDSTQDFLASEESKELRSGVKWVQTILRMNLWDAGEKLLGGRAAIALYPNADNPGEGIKKKPDAFIIIEPDDPRAWSKQRIWTDPILLLSAKRIAKDKAPRGVKIYQTKAENGAPRSYFALHKQWVMIASKPTYLHDAIQLRLGREDAEDRPTSLAADARLMALEKRHPGDHLGRAFIDTKLLSRAAGGRLGLPEKMGNPLASLIFGGMLEIAAHSDLACAALDFEDGEFHLRTTLDARPSELDPRFAVFFTGDAPARPIPQVPGLIAGITMHRDLATWYRSRDDLLQAQVLPGFDKFETGLGNILPGKDIGTDVIPLMGENFTLLSALQDYSYLDGEPGVKLPGFAIVIDLAGPDPGAGADMFQLFFQTFLSILNLQAAEQDRQPWLIAAQDHAGTQITYARYFEKPSGEQLPTVFNFLPAAARVGDQYIISSSLGLCEDLIDSLKDSGGEAAGHNSHGHVEFAGLARAMDLNRQHLVASRINEGRDTEHAVEDIDHFFLALKHLGSLTSTGSTSDDGFALDIRGTIK